jgi:S1-C subfamily serine protease
VNVSALCRATQRQKFVIVALLLIASTPLFAQKSSGLRQDPGDLSSKIKQIRPSVVSIWVDGKRNGSGFVVSGFGDIMTATHVIGSPYVTPQGTFSVNYLSNIEVVFSDGTRLSAKPTDVPGDIAALDDSAMLKVDRVTPDHLKLSTTPREDGTPVLLMGFPLDLPNAVTYTGTIASHYQLPAGDMNGKAINKSMIQVQAPIAKGFSGSALVDYKTNEVIGIVEIKIGGINENLQKIALQIQQGQQSGARVTMMGVDPNASLLELIGVLDAYLSAGSGSAVSVEHIYAFAQEKSAGKKQ